MPPVPHQTERPLLQRLAWFITLWAGGVATVAIIGYGIRVWIK
ncbi:DUF2474 domain-containing protein [Tardiphaga sp.]|nr:DUF2474 domain-containing protein [Tardiphaga sp.]MDB5620353.1 hypothetical protein [Tardiphaga sp.]